MYWHVLVASYRYNCTAVVVGAGTASNYCSSYDCNNTVVYSTTYRVPVSYLVAAGQHPANYILELMT